MARHRIIPMPMAALAIALSLLEDGVADRGGAAAPIVVSVGELVGDTVVGVRGDTVVGDKDAEDEVGGGGEKKDGDEIPLPEDIPGAVGLEAPVGKLVILGPHVCGDMASLDVIVKTGVLAQSLPVKSSSCM